MQLNKQSPHHAGFFFGSHRNVGFRAIPFTLQSLVEFDTGHDHRVSKDERFAGSVVAAHHAPRFFNVATLRPAG